MPIIYLSPSTQEGNYYVNGGTEEEYMNLLADKMVPYLDASGIRYTRNTPDMTAASSIAASNAGNYDLHLALHSNAAPESLSGKLQGTDVYYYTGSTQGRRAAEVLAENFKKIYPDPSKVRAVPTTSLVELTKTNAPAVLMEIAYHDNPEDARWIKENIQAIAANIVQGLCLYFGIPFIADPQPPQTGTVVTQSTPLNIRKRPSTQAQVLTQAQKGEQLTVLGKWQGWYVVEVHGIIGYASAEYIQV